MTHDFKAAIDFLPVILDAYEDAAGEPIDATFDETPVEDLINTIIHALKLADKVTGEPSYGMANVGKWSSFERCEGDEELEEYSPDNDECSEIFKAMIAQAQKEIE